MFRKVDFKLSNKLTNGPLSLSLSLLPALENKFIFNIEIFHLWYFWYIATSRLSFRFVLHFEFMSVCLHRCTVSVEHDERSLLCPKINLFIILSLLQVHLYAGICDSKRYKWKDGLLSNLGDRYRKYAWYCKCSKVLNQLSWWLKFWTNLLFYCKVIVGYIGDKTWIKTTNLYSLFTTISGFAIFFLPLIQGYEGFVILAAIYGFAISVNYTLITGKVVDWKLWQFTFLLSSKSEHFDSNLKLIIYFCSGLQWF